MKFNFYANCIVNYPKNAFNLQETSVKKEKPAFKTSLT